MVGSRQEEGQGCQDVEAEWRNFNSSADKAVPGLEGELNTTETGKAISSLNNLNNRATLTDDLKSCAQEDSRQVVVVLIIVRIRFYVFWCGWFRMTIVEVRITIIILELGLMGPTTISTELPLTAETTDPAKVPTTLPETIETTETETTAQIAALTTVQMSMTVPTPVPALIPSNVQSTATAPVPSPVPSP